MEEGCLSEEEVRSTHKTGKQGVGEGKIPETWRLAVGSQFCLVWYYLVSPLPTHTSLTSLGKGIGDMQEHGSLEKAVGRLNLHHVALDRDLASPDPSYFSISKVPTQKACYQGRTWPVAYVTPAIINEV